MKNRHSKIYYTSGMISLILIPILGYWIIDRREQRCIEIVMCSKDTTCTFCYKCKPPERIYKTVPITGDQKEDSRNLTLIDSVANSYYINEDTVNGLKVEFLNNARYESLIKVLDICNMRHIPEYMLIDNHLWLLFDFVNLQIGDKNYKTKNLGPRRRLLKGEYFDFEIVLKDKIHSHWDCYTDNVGFDDVIKKKKEEKEKKQFYDFIYEKRFLLVLLTLIYTTMLLLTIAKLIKSNK